MADAADPRVRALAGLLTLVDRFRRPEGVTDGGCAWYEAQTGESLIPYLQEETAELVEAIEHGSAADRREELGDVLFQVLFHADLAAAAGEFDLGDVADDQAEKLRRRNPHVFGDRPTRDIDAIIEMWRAAKAIEKSDRESVLDGIAFGMPALALAAKVLGRAAEAGIAPAVIAPDAAGLAPAVIAPDTADFAPAVIAPDTTAADDATDPDAAAVAHPHSEAELGDALLAAVVLARESGWDAERALRGAVSRFAETVRANEAARVERRD